MMATPESAAKGIAPEAAWTTSNPQACTSAAGATCPPSICSWAIQTTLATVPTR